MYALEQCPDGGYVISYTGPMDENWRLFDAFWFGAGKEVVHKEVKVRTNRLIARFMDYAAKKQWQHYES